LARAWKHWFQEMQSWNAFHQFLKQWYTQQRWKEREPHDLFNLACFLETLLPQLPATPSIMILQRVYRYLPCVELFTDLPEYNNSLERLLFPQSVSPSTPILSSGSVSSLSSSSSVMLETQILKPNVKNMDQEPKLFEIPCGSHLRVQVLTKPDPEHGKRLEFDFPTNAKFKKASTQSSAFRLNAS